MAERDDDKPDTEEAETSVDPTRRDFLVTTGLGTAALAVGCGDDSSAIDAGGDATLPDGGTDTGIDAGTDAGTDGGVDAGFDAAPPVGPEVVIENTTDFPLGIASGDAATDSVVVWTQYTGSAPLRARMWSWDGASYVALVGDLEATVADGGFVHVTVEGLAAGQRHRYAFFEMSGDEPMGRSAIGEVRTAIASDSLEPIRLGAVSCTRNGRDFAAIGHAGARTDLDAFLLLGDTTYNDGASSLAEFRAKWAENFGDENYIRLRRSVGVYATWDDHEIDNNWNPETENASKVRAGFDAFFEHLPLRRIAGNPDRIWRSQRWGQTLEVFVLDCRSERLPSTRTGASAQYFSVEQLSWLQTSLTESTARFKVIMNSVGITDFPFGSDADRWQGYAAQREQLLRFVEDNAIPGVLWVAGDFHYACLGHVGDRDGALGWNQWEVLVGPGANTTNPAYLLCRPPQFPTAFGNNNYTELYFDPASGQVTITWFGRSNDVVDTQTITP